MPRSQGSSKKATNGSDGLTYDQAVSNLTTAVELLHGGRLDEARQRLTELRAGLHDEPVLDDRCASYLKICEQRMAGPVPEPTELEDLYYQAVIRSNDGKPDEAIRLLDQAIQSDPNSARLLYARASAWSLKGNAEAAVGDLRQAIAGEPELRFQAANDPDFEPIREEPAFIDVIEPTPSGS